MGPDADAIVVGSGPGGASAAYFLTRAGLRALVLDRAKLPRYKPCGGAVPRKGLDIFPFPFDRVVERRVEQATFVLDGRRITHDVERDWLALVMRDRFDAHLLEQAGCEVCEGTEVTGLRRDGSLLAVETAAGQSYRAPFLVGADGSNSRVARLAGLCPRGNRRAAVVAEVPVAAETLEAFAARLLIGFGLLPSGYYWIFPKSSHLTVGIGGKPGSARRMRALLEQVMSGYGIPADRSRKMLHTVPVYTRRHALQSEGVLLVGDAAQLVDPLTGEGIRFALESGKMAAEAIARGRPESYSVRVHKHIGRNLGWGRLCARAFYARQKRGFDWLLCNTRIFRDMMHIMGNNLTYPRSLLKFPLYLSDFRSRVRPEA
jgi:geranylgeranyl reductase family protein